MATFASTSEAILRCARTSIIAGGYNGFSYPDIAAVVHGPMLSTRAYGDPQVFAVITRSAIDRLRSTRVDADDSIKEAI